MLTEGASDIEATRAGIIGMLIAAAALDPEQEILRSRKMTVGGVVPDQPTPAIEPLNLPRTENVIVSIEKRG